MTRLASREKETPISTYMESTGHSLAEALSKGTVGLPGPFITIKATTAQEVMRYRLPLLAEDVTHDQWVGWGAPPPGPQTAGTAVAFNKFGKGQSLYLGVPIFWAMQWRASWIQNWIPGLIRASGAESAGGDTDRSFLRVRAWHFLPRCRQAAGFGPTLRHHATRDQG